MAPQPKRKHSGHRGRIRAIALRIGTATLTPCPSCQKLRIPHRVCPYCGFYDGRVFVEKKADLPAGKTSKPKHEDTK